MRPDLSQSALVELALDLSRSLTSDDRYERLLDRIRKLIPCDSIALLSVDGDQLRPLALQGLMPDVLGRRFRIADHPRFRQICSSRSPVKFPGDCDLPDPYDGLLLAHNGDLPVHACMGLPLYYDADLIGVLTLDTLAPGTFDQLEPRTLHLVTALAAASLRTALTLEILERKASHNQRVVEELSRDVRQSREIIGESPPMQALKKAIAVVAGSDFTVLIQGQTGTGKELVARQVHLQSRRAQQPLVQINCAALPEQLVESELFGHVKGAFTGAANSREGKFSLADGGTLFLDEVGELPLTIQGKLLRALQDGEIQPVGQDRVQNVNVRVIAATNRDLEQEVTAGRFRADLYHRLSVYPLNVPPLHDRHDDMPLLAGFFAERVRRQLGIRQLKISVETIERFREYNWPGNVRELEHTISRAALSARARQEDLDCVTILPGDCGYLRADSGGEPAARPVESMPALCRDGLRKSTEDFQRTLIIRALKETGGNWAAAARILQTDRANLVRLGKRLKLDVQKRIHARVG